MKLRTLLTVALITAIPAIPAICQDAWFEDPILEQCVLQDWDSDDNGVIDYAEAQAVTWIQCNGVTNADAIKRHFPNVQTLDLEIASIHLTPAMWAAPYADLRDGNIQYTGNLIMDPHTFVDLRNNPIPRMYQACGPPFCPVPIVWDQCSWLAIFPNVITDLDCGYSLANWPDLDILNFIPVNTGSTK